MTMRAFACNEDDGVWEAEIRPEWMPILECRVYTGDFNMLPTEAQDNAAYDIAGLSQELVAGIRQLIESALLAAADYAPDLEDVTEPEFESVLIPRQRDDDDRFAFLFFDSDVPCDIECVVVVRNGEDFRVCDDSTAWIEYNWDDNRLKQLFETTK